MASSWVTTPHPRPSFDTVPPEPHPGLLIQNSNLNMASSQSVTPDAKLAQERAGPFAISAAQICVKIGEDGQPSLPSNVVFDKRSTHTAPAVVTLQVESRPPAPSNVHTDVFAAPPSPKQKQVARPRSPPSSYTFERQVLASALTTNSQAVAPISAASDLTPPLAPHSPEARPIPTTDISTTGSPTTGFLQLPALNQSPNQSPNLERGAPGRQPPKRSGTSITFGTSASNSIAQTKYTDMVFEEIPFRFNVMTCIFMWIVLAGFLVLPSSFPDLQTILLNSNSNKLTKVVRVARNIPLLIIGFTCCGVGAIGLCYIWWRLRHNYVWLLSSIFIPGMFNGLSGLISTFVNLYGSQDGVHYGATTIATIAATGGCAVICGFLTIIYTIKKHYVQRHHNRIERERCDSRDEVTKL